MFSFLTKIVILKQDFTLLTTDQEDGSVLIEDDSDESYTF